jgi:hypothetical protein
MISMSQALSMLQAVPKVVAALPEFGSLWSRIVSTFTDGAQQADLQAAYTHAISDAENAHTQLQDIVSRHSGG